MTEREKAVQFNREVKSALETVYESLNQGQQQKLWKDPQVKALLERYGVGRRNDGPADPAAAELPGL